MADPSSYRPAPGSIPEQPGVYKFRDASGRVIYVGKAKSLRSRLNSYFADLSGLAERTYRMVTTAASVEWTVVSTEVEALQLEYNWIKEFDPRFNIRYRDDKSYPVLAVTLNEEYPRLFVYRGARKKGVRYFGPYAHAWAIRETLDTLLRVFPARTCSAGVFKRHGQIGRPCLLGYIDKCSAPCVGQVNADEHRAIVLEFCDFLAGNTDKFVRSLDKRMRQAAEDLDFELAARLRDDAAALRRALEKQTVVLGRGTQADVVGIHEDELEVSVQVFHVRDGRVRGQRGWIVDRGDAASTGEVIGQFLLQFYGEQAAQDARAAIPREVLVPALPADADQICAWLTELRGSTVELRIPQRGDKRELAETVRRNAHEAMTQHKLKRATDLTARSAALEALGAALDMREAPLRIECVDISHVQGTDVVASLVVFEDGLARKSEYRRFAIRHAAGGGKSDDVASIAEVTRRRFSRLVSQGSVDKPGDVAGIDPLTGRPRKFAYPPNLYVVDGGPAQVAAAARELTELGVDNIAVVGLAKRLEEVWVPGEADPVILPRNSEALFLLQRIRDEAHRFAITYHRSKRSRRMTESALDSIAGIGEVRRNALVQHFGSVAKLKQATELDIAAVAGIGIQTAKLVHQALQRD